MSGFDENPFGEPTINDPFSDPAVKRAATSTPATRGMEDYNPFGEPALQANAQVRGAANPPIYGGIGATQQPATLQPTTQEVPPPPIYARSAQQTMSPTSGGTFVEQLADDGIRNSSYYPRRNNWPPLPEQCCFQPCFYQDIDVEIHTDFQKVVRQLYYLWMFHGLVLLLNVFGGLILLLFTDENFKTFSLALLYLILFTPISFVCWFRPAYKAFRSDSSINFMAFFFVFFFQMVVTGIQAIGIPGLGSCGLIMALTSFERSAKGFFVGITLSMIAICYGIAFGSDLFLLTKIHRIYRTSNASMSKAQQEFTTTFLRNEHVQSAAGNVVASAVRAQMSNPTQPRY